jgi:hypothetical protein
VLLLIFFLLAVRYPSYQKSDAWSHRQKCSRTREHCSFITGLNIGYFVLLGKVRAERERRVSERATEGIFSRALDASSSGMKMCGSHGSLFFWQPGDDFLGKFTTFKGWDVERNPFDSMCKHLFATMILNFTKTSEWKTAIYILVF